MRLIIFFVAIALAAGAFVLTSRLTNTPKNDTLPITEPKTIIKDAPTADIYIARQDIAIGTIITPEMLDIAPYPKNLLLDGMIQADPQNPVTSAVRMVARTPFLKGEPLFMNKLGNENDPSFVAAALPKGMRAVTIAVDTISGVGNFVFPGDRVDVLITHDVEVDNVTKSSGAVTNIGNKKDPITEVLLSNIKVLAMNQKPVMQNNNDQQQPAPVTNITLEVASVDAQKLRLTESGNGRLSLVLRSLKDRDENELARPTGLSDLSRLTPPAYFPVLYETTDKTAKNDDASTATPSNAPMKSLVNVVRGVRSEAVEVSQP